MLFAIAIGNPPFKKNLHLQVINSVIPHIDNGCFIHPARWFEDPLTGYKNRTDKVKFKDVVDRLEDVKIIDKKNANKKFGITFNGELMISKVGSMHEGKDIRIYSETAQKCIDVILAYSKNQNLGQHVEKNKIDGWRVQVKEITPLDPHIDSMTEYSRKCQSNLFAMNKVNVFHNGFYGATEWMKTRRQTLGKKVSGDPIPESIKFRTKKEAVNFEESCNTNFYNNILYLLKLDMHTPLNFLPWMDDYSHPWTDKDYCRFFGEIGLDRECQKWMCREVYDYRIKDFIKKGHTASKYVAVS